MKSAASITLCAAATIGFATPALAASDYYLVIDGVDGEASVAIEVQSWSWGATNLGAASGTNLGSSGQDGVARETPSSRPTVTASQNTQSLREAPTRRVTKLTASQNSQSLRESSAAPDLDGDGRADLSALEQLVEVSGFTLALAPGSPAARQLCSGGKHIAKAHLVGRQGVIDFEDLAIGSCSEAGAGAVALKVTGKTKEFKGHVTLLK